MLAVMPKGHPFAAYDEVPIELYANAAFVVSDYTYLNDVHRILKTANVTGYQIHDPQRLFHTVHGGA